MSSLFSARRKPKRIARDEDSIEQDQLQEDTGPVVRRPNAAPRAKSKLRSTYNPDDSLAAEGEEVRPIKPTRTGPATGAKDLPRYASSLSISERQEVDRPTYNRSYLDELRQSTPTTPRDLSLHNSSAEDEAVSNALDVVVRTGQTTVTASNHIPSAAEIKEKKERRARLAREQAAQPASVEEDGFIALEDYDSDGEFKPRRMQVGSFQSAGRYGEKDTRLVREDEDIAEGFDDFVEDAGSNRITMSRKGVREEERRARERIREQIEDAEGSDEDEDDDSDASRNYAYESAQTHHGLEGTRGGKSKRRRADRPRRPDKVMQVPALNPALDRLREVVQTMEAERLRIEKQRADIHAEDVARLLQQDQIRQGLEDLGQKLEQVHAAAERGTNEERKGRCLESLGGV